MRESAEEPAVLHKQQLLAPLTRRMIIITHSCSHRGGAQEYQAKPGSQARQAGPNQGLNSQDPLRLSFGQTVS